MMLLKSPGKNPKYVGFLSLWCFSLGKRIGENDEWKTLVNINLYPIRNKWIKYKFMALILLKRWRGK